MNWLLAPAFGVLFCFGIAPYDQWWVMAISIAGIFVLCLRNSTSPALLLWLYGLGKFGFGASWVYVSINEFGNASPPLATFLVFLFTCFTAFLFCWPLGLLYERCSRSIENYSQGGARLWAYGFVFVGLWGLMDWVTTWLLTGFPWLYAGNGLLESAFSGWIPVVGVLGTSTLFVASVIMATIAAILLWQLIGQRGATTPRLLIGGVLVGGVLAALPWMVGGMLKPIDWVVAGDQHSVALVQGNLDQHLKWQRGQTQANVARHVDLSAQHWDVDLLLWPEAAITAYPQQAERLLEQLATQAQATETAFVFGIPGFRQVDDAIEFQNLAMGVGLARGRYAKHHLVPFGEYVPFAGVLRGLIDFFDLPMSSSSPGGADQPNLATPFGELAMAICYEVAYPGSMRSKAQTAAVLATISNDTWFGQSLGPLQHMQLAQVRAAENGRWMLRATNNGITGIIDHRGRITAQLAQFEGATLRGTWQAMSGHTPYARYGNLWLFIGLALCLLPAIGGIFAARLQTDD